MYIVCWATKQVGKWHLGQNVLAALPTGRGFQQYYGYWSGAEDYYTHECRGAYDIADGTKTDFSANGTYSTPLFTSKAIDMIRGFSREAPWFMYLAYQNIHWPLEAPQSYLDRFANSTGGNEKRQAIAAMTAILDEGLALSLSLALTRCWTKVSGT